MGKRRGSREQDRRQLSLFPPEDNTALGGSAGYADPQDLGFSVVDPGSGSPADFGAEAVLLAYGELKQQRSKKRPYEFRIGSLLGVTGRTEGATSTSPNDPELFFVERPAPARKPYDLNRLSGGGQIYSPLLIAGGYLEEDDSRSAYVHVPKVRNIPGVRSLSLAGEVDRSNHANLHSRPLSALLLTPPCTFLFSHEVGPNGDFPFTAEYAARFVWLEVVNLRDDSRRWFGVSPGRHALLVPKLGWAKLLSATTSYDKDPEEAESAVEAP